MKTEVKKKMVNTRKLERVSSTVKYLCFYKACGLNMQNAGKLIVYQHENMGLSWSIQQKAVFNESPHLGMMKEGGCEHLSLCAV